MQKMHTLKERTNVTLDGKKLQGDEPQGKLLGIAGSQIPLEDAIALGLVEGEAEVKEDEPSEDKDDAPAETKGKKKK